MRFIGYVFLATSALLCGSALAQNDPSLIGQKGAEVTDFSCNGLPNDYYPHPDNCAAYLYCAEEIRAYEFECNIGKDGKQMHFKTFRAPGDNELCGPPEIACCGCHKPPTTTSTTTPPPPPTPSPGNCDPEVCKLDGYCDCFEQCVAGEDGVGRLVEKNCTEDLFWLPNDITGGTCVYFDNLPGQLQDQYRNDTTCIEKCEWFQKPEDVCSPRYTYRKEFDGHTIIGREVDLSCPPAPPGRKPLYWVQSKLVCDTCDEAVDENGYACSCQ